MTATHEAKALPPEDRRAMWDNSPELREAVRDDLYEWGGAQRGGMPDLGYPKRDIVFTVDAGRVFTYNVEKVDAINDAFTLWRLIVDKISDRQTRKIQRRQMRIIKHYFIGSEPVESISSKMGIGISTTYKDIGDAMYRVWALGMGDWS